MDKAKPEHMSSKNVLNPGDRYSPSDNNARRAAARHEAVHETPLDRMLLATGCKTQTELARVLGVGKAAVSDAKRKHSLPAKWYQKLSLPPYNVNPAWVETGLGSKCLGDYAVAEKAEKYGEADYAFVPMARARPSQDGEGLDMTDAHEGGYAFRRSWLHAKGVLESMRLMRISGDSMRPTLHDDDVVLVDESQKDVLDGKIYVIRMDDEIVVKRITKKPGALLLVSDNRSLYDPMEVTVTENPGVSIIGRVVWLARESV